MSKTDLNNILDHLSKSAESSDAVSQEEIRKGDIPPFVKSFFELQAEKLYREVRRFRLTQKRFDYNLFQVRRIAEIFDDTVKATVKFTKKECFEILKEAFKFESSYWVDPAQTLASLTYGKEKTLLGEIIFVTLQILEKDKKELSRSWTWEELSKLNDEVPSDKFMEMIDETIREKCAERPLESIIAAVSSVSRAMFLLSNNNTNNLNLDIVDQIIEKRKLDFYKRALEEQRQKGVKELGTEELIRLLEQWELLQGTKETRKTAFSEERVSEELREYELFLAKATSEIGSDPLLEQHNLPLTNSKEQTFQEPPSSKEQPNNLEEKKEEELPKKERLKRPPGAPLLQLKDSEVFLENLFNKDREAYENLIFELMQADSWVSAGKVLDEVLKEYKIDIYSEVAVKFVDTVYETFKELKSKDQN